MAFSHKDMDIRSSPKTGAGRDVKMLLSGRERNNFSDVTLVPCLFAAKIKYIPTATSEFLCIIV